MYDAFEFLTQTQLGEIFDETRNAIGLALEEIGWRVREGKKLYPSIQAIERGYCRATENEHGIRYFIWHRLETIKALEAAGYKQVSRRSAPTKLDGPFSVEASGEAGYKINCGDGTTAIWVLGDENARIVVAALNKEFGFGSGA